MAVDFSLLPNETPEPDKPPSRLGWAVVFLLLVLIGVFIVLLAWPKGQSTQTSDFWGTVILFPVGIPALMVLLRFQHYYSRKLDVQLSNKAARRYNERVFATASVPLAVLGASHRFSADAAENAVASILSGALRLEVQELFSPDSEPEKVRWLEVPNVKLRTGTNEDDEKRQIEVTRWLFREMLEELAGAIKAVPKEIGLEVHLLISGLLTGAESQTIWQESWSSFQLRPARVVRTAADSGSLQMIDVWLDQIAGGHQQKAKLIAAIQLHSLLGGSPPKGAAEAGVALLLMPDALASQHETIRIANLHRPVRGTVDLLDKTLAHALKWSNSTVNEISGGWQTGLALAHSGVLRTSAVKAGLEVQLADLDPRVGCAGVAAPWLATACAVRSFTPDAPFQIVFAGHAQAIDCVVLRAVCTGRLSSSFTERESSPEIKTEPQDLPT